MSEITENAERDAARFFHQHKNLAYHIAFALTQQEELSENVVEMVMQDFYRSGLMNDQFSHEDQKALLTLMTRHRAVVAARAEAGKNGAAARDVTPKPSLIGDAEVSAYGDLIGRIPTRDRVVLFLSVLFHLSDETIASVLRLKKASVATRKHRSLLFIAEQSHHAAEDLDEMAEEEPFQTALKLWMKSRVNSMEALSNMEPHTFPIQMEERTIQAMNGTGRSFAHGSVKDLLSRNSMVPFVVGLVILFLILLFLLVRAFQGKRIAQDANSMSLSLSSSAEESSQEPITETRHVDPAEAAYFEDHLIFIDAKSGILYRVEKDHPASGLINLRKNLEETGGVEHVGEQDGKIYLAFMDGRGGIISGQPAKISLEDYWQEDWFTNQKADPTVPSVVINSVEYLFTRQESAPEETVNQEEALGESALLEGEQQ